MPHLVRWHNELGDFGLVVLGQHVQSVPDEEVRAKVEALGIRFPITKGGSVAGAKQTGAIPHTFVFDHEGKCIFEGHPTEAESKLRAAVGKALIVAAGLDKPHRTLKPMIDDLEKGKSPLPVLQKLLPLQKAGDKEAAGQAKALVEKMLAGGQKKFDEAKAGMKDDPVASFDAASRVGVSFKGTPLAQQATELAGKLRSDKKVAAELRARPILESVKRLDAVLAAAAKKSDPKEAEFKKAAAAQLKQMSTFLSQLKRNYPDSRAAKEAAEIGERYEIVIK